MKTDRLVAQTRLQSPVGPLTLAATDEGLAFLLFDEPVHYHTDLEVPVDADNPFIAAAARQLEGYWRGECPARFDVPLDLQGTAFQRAVWQALLGVRPGETSTYGAIARQVGAPHASRAAGAAIGRNPVAIIVPCHRIVGSNGSLTGFAGGLQRKELLLQHEGALLV
ncbi:MAG: methylated-DNA--[protein]-cysteine S-methyltransferase [Burkholderiaceae bacterium]|nr:methylated-DNA--[protein]-cysteine S-methyltransferase [Burkholderiaceae bacterium]